jgi:hypothetical protein
VSAVRGWQLWVDWSGGGGLTGPLEDATEYVDRGDITVGWGRGVDSLDQGCPASELTFSLFNRTLSWERWFSPENPASPIAGKIMPGKDVTFTRKVRGSAMLLNEAWSSSGAGVNGWAASGGGIVSRVSSPSEDGNGSLQYVPPGAVATVGVTTTARFPLTSEPDGSVAVSFRVLSNTTWSDVRGAVDWYDNSGALLSSSAGAAQGVTSGTWVTIQSDSFNMPALAASCRPRLQVGSTPANTITLNIDYAIVTSTPDDAGKIYTLHSGVLDDFSVDPNATARTFTGKTLDASGRPSSANLSTPVYSGVRTGDAINIILDQLGWAGGRAIDPGATLISWWWEEGTDPAEAIEKLVNSEGPPAIAYVEAGTFVFRDRHHRIRSAASQTARGIISHIIPAGSGPGVDYKIEKGSFTYDQGLKTVVNTVKFSVDLRRPQVSQEVWSQTDPLAMSAGDVQTIFAEPSDPVINAIAPNAYDGTLDVLSGSFTTSIDRTSGQKIAITVTCTGSGVINTMSLHGSPITVSRTVQVQSSDSASVGRFGTSVWPNDAPWVNQYDAQAIADKIVATYADYRPRITFTLVAINDRYESLMLALRLGDRVTVRNDSIGLNQDFHVEKLDHVVSRLSVHRVTVSCILVEPSQPSNPFTFGVSGAGFNQGFFATPAIDNPSQMFVFDQAGQGFGQGLFAT